MNAMANSIRTLRLAKNMTQAQLAKSLGVQYQTISKWETGITMPDTAMLPCIADFFGIPIDELFSRKQTGCAASIPDDKKDFLLRTYAQMFTGEAGIWNLSVENKYLEYRFADFFEKYFPVAENTSICNIGIGAGQWDLYLTCKLKNGSLTSIDKLEACCRQLEQRLLYEENPHTVNVICADAMNLNLDEHFDIVTMVGSTVIEGGIGLALFEKASRFVRKGGTLYYQSLDSKEDCNAVLQAAYRHGMKLAAFFEDNAYSFHCHYYKFEKE